MTEKKIDLEEAEKYKLQFLLERSRTLQLEAVAFQRAMKEHEDSVQKEVADLQAKYELDASRDIKLDVAGGCFTWEEDDAPVEEFAEVTA